MTKRKPARPYKRLGAWLRVRPKPIITAAILVLLAGYSSYILLATPKPAIVTTNNEIRQIVETNDLKIRIKLYRALIDRLGPEQAQEELFHSGLPFTGETHLLNHTVGDYIYEKHGIEGITMCRNYFLESCYHGLLLHVIGGNADKDLADVTTIMTRCDAAGPTVAVQCAHGIGHGYVAAVGYGNLDRGLAQCKVLGEKLPGFPVFNCLDGGFMENIWAVHEGETSPDRWIKESDDFYPCNDPRLADQAYGNPCWSNQPSLLFQRYQGDISKVGKICLTVTQDTLRQTCFNGLARQIHPMTENKIDSVYAMCAQLPQEWQNYCHTTIVNAAFSVGDRKLPYEMCALASGEEKNICYSNLIGSIQGSSRDNEEVRRLCLLITETDQAPREQCLEETKLRGS